MKRVAVLKLGGELIETPERLSNGQVRVAPDFLLFARFLPVFGLVFFARPYPFVFCFLG